MAGRSYNLARIMVGMGDGLHVQARHVLFLVWSVTLLRAPSDNHHPHPARLARSIYLSCTTVAALGPRADATVRSTSPPKIDVLSARSTETASGKRVRVTGELQRPKSCQETWTTEGGCWGVNSSQSRHAVRLGGQP